MKRALVVGSQIEGLRGVHNDIAGMQAMLERRGFDVDLRIDDRASRAGILAGYDQLIAASGPGDAAVFYYSGHGWYATVTEATPGAWQYIVPTDIRHGSDTDWRGITAWELSLKQAQLTARTKNVTVILDSCHAAQMSRAAAVREAIPRALPHPAHAGFAAHLGQLRAQYGGVFDAIDPSGNRDAVRLVACGQRETAFEAPGRDGVHRGAFTQALIEVLDEVGEAEVSWAGLRGAIRARVLREFPLQRPEIEGPLRRRVFSLGEPRDDGVVAIRAAGDRLVLPVGRLSGAVAGDRYGVMPVGATRHDAHDGFGELEVVEVRALDATAHRVSGSRTLPVDALAFPLTRAAVRRPVALAVPAEANDPIAGTIAGAIAASSTLRLATSDDEFALATLRLADRDLTIEDAWGPLFPPARFPDELAAVVANLANLGVAQGVRELEGEDGVYAHELAIELGLVEHGLPRALPAHGAALGLGDRIYVEITSLSQRQLYAHVFNIGVRGKVSSLTDYAPTGIAIERGRPAALIGQRPDGVLVGLRLSWPHGLPRASFPRVDELIVIVTSAPINLRGLETREQLPVTRGPGARLQGLLAQLHDGVHRDASMAPVLDGFLLKRLSYLLHPRDAALGGLAFEVDDNPAGQAAARDPAAWLEPADAITRSGARSPSRRSPSRATIAIRLTELIVERNHAMFSTDIRIDALICTRSSGPHPGHATWTQRFQRIRDGERLPLDHGLLYLGPVRDFVDITLFVSRDVSASRELARLFDQRTHDAAFRDAAGALLVTAGATAAPWVAAVGASAALARMAYDLVLAATGTSIGLYRTSFVGREQFGVGRHPARGLYRAQDFSFALSIEPVP